MKTSTLLIAGVMIVVRYPGELAMGQTKAPNWVRVTEHAAWQARDSCGEVEYKGKMWMWGGWFTSTEPGPRDVWNSADGRNWTLVTKEAPWRHGDLPTSFVFDDKMWTMGGWYGGRKPFASASNEVWYSTDGATWTAATKKAPWKPRLGAGGVAFDGKMWILGGIERYFDGTPQHLLNDVWYSTDGKNWKCATEKAPWAPRAYHGVLAFDNKMWVFGGGNYRPGYLGFNDVWSSSDGAHWTHVTDHAPWAARIWFSNVVYKNHMWILGGWSDNPSVNWNDVWYSSNGKDWKELKTETVWSKRHEQSFFVFQDKIWIAAGNEWPLVNDVWNIEIPDSWFKAQ